MRAIRIAKIALNVLIIVYVAVLAAVLATGGFSFTVLGQTFRANHLVGPLLGLVLSVAARAALSMPPKSLAVAALSLAVTLVGLEGFVRWWYPREAWPVLRLYYRPAPVVGYEMIPGVAGTGSFGEAIVINSHGLRDKERPWAKPPGVKRVVVVGDSFTFGMKVEASDSYPKALEALLNERGGTGRYDVVNAGVVAYSLCQERRWLDLKGWRYEPDLVVVGFFGDDPHCKGEDSGERFAETDTYRNFTRVSALYSFLKNSYNVFNARYLERLRPAWTGGLEARSRFLARSGFNDIREEEWEAAARDLKAIKEGADERGAKTLVIVIPDAGQVGFPKYQAPTRRLLAVCREHKIECLDLTPHIEAAPEPLKLYLYPLDAHLSPAGHRFVASVIAERLTGMGF